MKLYEYLIGGKKMGQGRHDSGKPLKYIEEGDELYMWNFNDNGNLERLLSWVVNDVVKNRDYWIYKGKDITEYVNTEGKRITELKPSIEVGNLFKNIYYWKSFRGLHCFITTFNDEKMVRDALKKI